MADIHKLATLFKELDDELVNCMRCGMCQAVCPVFGQTGKETDVTRGKIALLDGLANHLLQDPDGVNATLSRCLMCGTCEANCPSGVNIMNIFLKARAIMTGYYGLPPIKKAIFRGLLANPRLFNSLTAISSHFQSLFTKKVDELLGSSCARFNNPVIGDRHFNTLATKPFRRIYPKIDTPAGHSGLRVALYPGCVVDKMFPSIGTATVKALQHHGVGIFMPSGQACCGIPVLSSGDRQTFNELVEQNVARFRNDRFDYLVTPCASCTATIKELWPKMYDGGQDIQTLAEELANKTMDISQFLIDVIGVQVDDREAAGESVTYHDPCHLKNSLKISEQPRKLLQSSGKQFVEMADAATCCGCGGTFNVHHYEMSKKIGTKKAENIVASKATTVATSCPACMMQITDMLSRRNAGISVKHVIELYSDNL
ncbi:(Fe-S)-binding protein [Desulforhopalus singaporensis]|uniref:Glycolate oxidase iron-sulfur subunit n=1 Tax=Desulforhopalus singaporensis TaxID=91360 RepID=A0A1H0PQ31_9BACT|nr:(Fe-S)-binding protein [Desulforhopalus singaporensis]SDP07222.1 glycolate oxidase iron-sulfur subunit [Desulforhopalus singaporensis]